MTNLMLPPEIDITKLAYQRAQTPAAYEIIRKIRNQNVGMLYTANYNIGERINPSWWMDNQSKVNAWLAHLPGGQIVGFISLHEKEDGVWGCALINPTYTATDFLPRLLEQLVTISKNQQTKIKIGVYANNKELLALLGRMNIWVLCEYQEHKQGLVFTYEAENSSLDGQTSVSIQLVENNTTTLLPEQTT